MRSVKSCVLSLAALVLAASSARAAPPTRIAACPRYDGVVTMTGRGFPDPTTCLYDEHGEVRAAIVRYDGPFGLGRAVERVAVYTRARPYATTDPSRAPGFDLDGIAGSDREASLDTPAVRAQIDRLLPRAAPVRPPAPPAPARTAAAASTPPPRANEQILVRYAYDALGRVRTKIGDEGVRHFIYDGDSRRVLEEFDDQGHTVASFVWAGERLVSVTRPGAGTRYPILDGLGSVVGLIDDQGAVTASYHYDAWGQYRFPNELSADANRYGFTGQIFESETGLYRSGERYFDPGFGRFLTQDSERGQFDQPASLHRYLYGWDRPTFFIDPDGRAVRVFETAPQRTGFRLTPEGYTEALTYATALRVEDDQPTAYALPQTTGRILAPVNTLAEDAARVPLGVITVGGAAGIERALREGRAGLDDPASLATAYTEGNANALTFGGVDAYVDARAGRGRSMSASVLAGGAGGIVNALPIDEGRTLVDADASGYDKAKAVASGGLKVLGLATLARGAFGERPGLPAVAERATAGKVELRVLDSQFTPDATKVLQNITRAQAQRLEANPALARRYLSPTEYKAGQRSEAVARLNYGKAVERMVAREIRDSELHGQLFDYAGGPNKPDFAGVLGGPAEGLNFDITTPGQVQAHLARPRYGLGLNVVTYQRPPLFKLFP